MKNPTPELTIIIIMSALPIEHLSEWRMTVCRKCQQAIWPAQVQSHFQGPQASHERQGSRTHCGNGAIMAQFDPAPHRVKHYQ